MRVRAVAVAIGLLVVVARAAEAAPAEAPPTAMKPPSAAGLATGQIVLGSMVLFLGEGAVVLLAREAHSNLIAFPALLLGPALGGAIVCRLGESNEYYTGPCGSAVAGAYLGALMALPAAYLGCTLDRSHGDEAGCTGGAIVGFAVGYVLGTAVGATVGWHITKRLRAPAPLALDALPELRRRAGPPGADGPPRVSVGLLSLAF